MEGEIDGDHPRFGEANEHSIRFVSHDLHHEGHIVTGISSGDRGDEVALEDPGIA